MNQVTREYWTEGGTSKENLYDYDLNGNTISKEEKSSGVRSCSWEYIWDQENRLINVDKKDTDGTTILYSVEYQYCPGCSGARTARIKRDASGDIESWYRYEEQGLNTLRVDEKYDSDNDGVLESADSWRCQRVCLNDPDNVGQILKETVYGYASATSSTPNSTNGYYYAYDHVGNVVNLYNDAGELVEGSLFEQDAFGNEINQSWNLGDVKRHQTGKEYDFDTGLFFFSARWYNPTMGLFVSGDPLTGSAPAYSYVFCDDDPVNNSDPTGLCVGCGDVSIMGGRPDPGKCGAYLQKCKEIYKGNNDMTRACNECSSFCGSPPECLEGIPAATLFNACMEAKRKGDSKRDMIAKLYKQYIKFACKLPCRL